MMTQAGALPPDALPSALAGKPVFDARDYRDE
jgi:hypothetical protein